MLVAGGLIGMQATPEPAYAGQWVPAPRRCVCSACLGCRLDRLKDLSAFFGLSFVGFRFGVSDRYRYSTIFGSTFQRQSERLQVSSSVVSQELSVPSYFFSRTSASSALYCRVYRLYM